MASSKNMINRSEENMKEVAFEIAREYLISFTPYKKSQIALVVHDKGTNRKIKYNKIRE
jgi:hypothetical protein